MSAYKKEMERVHEKLDKLWRKIPVDEIRDVVRGLGFALSAHDSTDTVWKDLEAAREIEMKARELRSSLYSLTDIVERKAGRSK